MEKNSSDLKYINPFTPESEVVKLAKKEIELIA